MMAKVAIVRMRGEIGVREDIKATLKMLNLPGKCACVIVEETDAIRGMIRKAKDYITWGPITEETFKALVEKRGKPFTGRVSDNKGKISYHKFIEVGGKKYEKTFRLHPPKGGFEEKGTKQPFTKGGVLGDRKEKINELIMKML